MLHELKRPDSLKKKSPRKGRGSGSGRGDFSGRGMAGQRSRSGFSRRAGFEGGQTTLAMRLPKKRGFKKYFKLQSSAQAVNLEALEQDERIKKDDTISHESLVELGYGKFKDNFKILARGDFSKSLKFEGLTCSQSAKEKIEKAGGSLSE